MRLTLKQLSVNLRYDGLTIRNSFLFSMVNLSHFSTRGSGIELARGKILPRIRRRLFTDL